MVFSYLCDELLLLCLYYVYHNMYIQYHNGNNSMVQQQSSFCFQNLNYIWAIIDIWELQKSENNICAYNNICPHKDPLN